MPYNYNNIAMMNQLYRQKENIENMINQYSQNVAQPPVQNIINTTGTASEIDVKFLKNNEDISNVIISKKTLFIDENNAKISIKETDGTISKVYDIIIPKDEKDWKDKMVKIFIAFIEKDEKDLKIEELEKKLRELEEKVNDKSTKSTIASNDVKSTTTSVIKPVKSTTATTF